MKAPLVFAGPGIPRGTSDALVYLFDIYPTVCDLVGAEVPEEIDGQELPPGARRQGDGAPGRN